MEKLNKDIVELVNKTVKQQLAPLENMLDSLFIQLLVTNTVDGQQLANLLQNFEPPLNEVDNPSLMSSLHARLLLLARMSSSDDLIPLLLEVAKKGKISPDWLQGVISSPVQSDD